MFFFSQFILICNPFFKMHTVDLELKISGKKYVVTVKRSNDLELGSKTFAKNWLASYKRVIMDNVNAINLYRPQIYALFCQNYYVIPIHEIEIINEMFNNVNERFTFIFKRFSEGNKNVFTFSNIDYLLSTLLDIAIRLKEIGQKHKSTALSYTAKSIILTLSRLEQIYTQDKNSLNIDDRYQKLKPLEIVKNDNDINKTAS